MNEQMDKAALEALVRRAVAEYLGAGIKMSPAADVTVEACHRLDTGNPAHRVWTRDLFRPEDNPRLGVGVMEMEDTAFPWTLNYDEADYVLSGRLTERRAGREVSAGPGEVILIPRGSEITFIARGRARFLYFVTPAAWNGPPSA